MVEPKNLRDKIKNPEKGGLVKMKNTGMVFAIIFSLSFMCVFISGSELIANNFDWPREILVKVFFAAMPFMIIAAILTAISVDLAKRGKKMKGKFCKKNEVPQNVKLMGRYDLYKRGDEIFIVGAPVDISLQEENDIISVSKSDIAEEVIVIVI